MVLLPSMFFLTALLRFPGQDAVSAAATILFSLLLIIIFFPSGSFRSPRDATPSGRIDERDIMFSRRLLKPGSERFDDYYAQHPENLEKDNRFRSQPGLLQKGSSEYNRAVFTSADVSFKLCEHLVPFIDGPSAKEKVTYNPEEISDYLKGWVKHLGAHSVGITPLKDYHLYSFGGRESTYGIPVTTKDTCAVAFTVEMDYYTVRQGPAAPTVMESAHEYARAALIAVQTAEFIRSLGYHARAHIDAAYQVVCPLVARDAGLGEIGRMGILITPDLGPRVRLGVVSTDMPLAPTPRVFDSTIIDFCRYCKKCAEACPARAISHADRKEYEGVLRWKIDSEKCFTYWCRSGTDCGRCMSVCPYSHPATPMHNLVRFFIKKSYIFRRVAVFLDDLIYGKNPKSLPLSPWQNITPREKQK